MFFPSIISGLLYRLGGMSKTDHPRIPSLLKKSYIRDIGIPILFLLVMASNRIALMYSAILLYISLTTYHKWLNPLFKKPKTDCYWFNYLAHGIGISLSIFPYTFIIGEWVGFYIRLALLPLLIMFWSLIWDDVDIEESGRGFLIFITLPICIGGIGKMENLLQLVQKHWVEIGVIAIAFHTFMKALRDAIDKTPQSDDNWFEKLCTILDKTVKYLFAGKRPNA